MGLGGGLRGVLLSGLEGKGEPTIVLTYRLLQNVYCEWKLINEPPITSLKNHFDT
jgi:hypothetical protein